MDKADSSQVSATRSRLNTTAVALEREATDLEAAAKEPGLRSRQLGDSEGNARAQQAIQVLYRGHGLWADAVEVGDALVDREPTADRLRVLARALREGADTLRRLARHVGYVLQGDTEMSPSYAQRLHALMPLFGQGAAREGALRLSDPAPTGEPPDRLQREPSTPAVPSARWESGGGSPVAPEGWTYGDTTLPRESPRASLRTERQGGEVRISPATVAQELSAIHPNGVGAACEHLRTYLNGSLYADPSQVAMLLDLVRRNVERYLPGILVCLLRDSRSPVPRVELARSQFRKAIEPVLARDWGSAQAKAHLAGIPLQTNRP